MYLMSVLGQSDCCDHDLVSWCLTTNQAVRYLKRGGGFLAIIDRRERLTPDEVAMYHLVYTYSADYHATGGAVR